MKTSLFDIQINGFAGVDFQQPNLSLPDLRRAVDALAIHETQRFFLTLITDEVESLCKKLENIERMRRADSCLGEAICGYHIEGPWISPEPGYCGAHNPKYMGSPTIHAFDRLQRSADGHIKLLTLAPELANSAEVIHHAVSSGVAISLGHTMASEGDIDMAISAGARFCTHLGNGVPVQMHRHDNIIQRLLARDELIVFLIPDGIHLPPFALQNFFRAKPPGRAFFTTDCMAATGAPPGRYWIGQHELEVGEDRVVHMPGHLTFAGSALSPDEGVENVIRWLGVSRQEARNLFSKNIAEAFGVTLPVLE